MKRILKSKRNISRHYKVVAYGTYEGGCFGASCYVNDCKTNPC